MKFAVLLLLIVGSSIAYGYQYVPIQNCNQDDEYLKPNTVSSYEYEVDARAKGIRRTANSFGLDYKCQVEVESGTHCLHTLKVTECTLTETDPVIKGVSEAKPHPDSSGFSAAMQKYSLNFVLTNGTIVTLITHQDESLPILNVKRGIVSALAAKKPSSVSSDETELLQDVQGICPVNYTVSGSDMVTMIKDINECHFPSRIDWHYSPFSLIWNMSFIQSLLIDAEAHCMYTFGSDGLTKSACSETHAIKLPTPADSDAISIQTTVSRDLTLKKVSPKSGPNTPVPEVPKSIMYEYERTTVPTTAPADLLSKAQNLMNSLMEGTHGQIEPGLTRHFTELVSLFRQAPELQSLEVISRPCVDLQQQCMQFTDLKPYQNEMLNEMAMNFFVDALVQCNSLPCIREVRRMDEKGHISGRHLDAILHAWSRVKITDTDFFTEIREICNRVQTRTCYLSLSAALHRFWTRQKHIYKKESLPKSVEDSVKDLMDLIGSDCSGPEKQSLMGLKSLGNMGGIAQKQVPNVEKIIHNCVYNNKAEWTVKVSAVQAARRLHPTNPLYTELWTIVKDPSLDLDVRVWAYKIIIKRRPDKDTLQEVKQFIASPDTTYQLKQFIASNLRNVLKDRSSLDAIKFSKLIREVFPHDEITDPSPDIEKPTESLELEDGAYHKVSFLDDAVSQFGLRILGNNFFDGKVFLPFASFVNFTVQLFGRDVNILEVLFSTRNQARTIAALAEHFSTMDDDEELDMGDLSAAIITKNEHVEQYHVDPDAPVKFNYKVDDTMRQNLERIRKKFPIGFDPSDLSSFLLSYRMFGDEMGFTTKELMRETFDRYKATIKEIASKPQHRSRAGSIIEAFHLVPTMAGLPLNWTTNTVIINHLDYNVVDPTKVTASFSGTIEEASGMIISLPGYAHGRIDTYSTATTAFDTGFTIEGGKHGLGLGIKLPSKTAKLVFSRMSTGCSRTTKVDMEEPNLGRDKNVRCVKPLGIEICHRSSHAKIDNILDTHWALMSKNAYWEMTVDFGDRAGKFLYTTIAVEDEPESKKIDVYLEGQESQPSLSMNYKVNDEDDTYASQLTIPKLGIRIDAAARPNDEEGRTTLISADIMNRKYQLELKRGQKVMEMLQRDLPNYEIEDKKTMKVDVYTDVAVLRSPSNLYSWNRTKTSFVNADIVEHELVFRPSVSRADKDRLLPDLWESPNEAWLKFGYQEDDVMNDVGHGYGYIRAPRFAIEGFTAVHETDDNTDGYANFTYTTLPSNKLESFFNVSFGKTYEYVDGKASREFGVQVALPRVNWALDVEHHRKSEPTYDGGFTLTVRRDEINPKDSKYEDEVEYWKPTLADHFTIDSQAMVINGNLHKKEVNDKLEIDLDGSLDFPGYEPITVNLKHIGSRIGFSLAREYALKNPNWNFEWKGTDKLVHQPPNNDDQGLKASYKHRSAFTLLSAPTEEFGIYVIEGTMDSDSLKAIERFQSNAYTYNSSIVWNYQAPEYSDLTLDIFAESPVWEFLNLKLNQVVFLKGEKMTMKNSLVDIDVDGSWKKGYQKNIRFTSKNTKLVPNMNWNLDCSDGQAIFTYDFPDRHLKIVEHATISKDWKEIQFTICKDRKCEDFQKDADAFISQYTYSLDDPTHIAEMVINNPENVAEIDDYIEKRVEKWGEWVVESLADGDHPVNKIAEPVLGMTIIEWCTSLLIDVAMTGASVSGKFVRNVMTLEPFARPVYRVFLVDRHDEPASDQPHDWVPAKERKSGEHSDELDAHLLHYIPWNYYDLRHLIEAYKEAAQDVDTDELSIRPGPVPGNSYVNVYEMPISMKSFSSLPSINYRYFEQKKEKEEDIEQVISSIFNGGDDDEDDDDDENSYDQPPFQYTFHHRKYTRFALIWGVGHALTFDGEHVDLPSPSKGGCSHLLLHNRVNGHVTVARETDSLLLMFPEVKIELTHDGRVRVNDSKLVTDLPVHGRNVNVTRWEDIIEVSTYHHLNIKCSLRHHYCLFATTEFTHNSLVGILGNNNGDPTDDIQQDSSSQDKFGVVAPFELSPSATCKAARKDACDATPGKETDVCYGELTRKLSYDYRINKCYQIVDWDEFHNRCTKDEECQHNGCASQMAYRALCGAHDIPMETFHKCSSCTNGQELDEMKTITIESEAEIIFLLDTTQKTSPSEMEKRVSAIAAQIQDAFKSASFKDVTFGLTVFTSNEDHTDYAEQYAMNGNLFASLNDFVNYGVKRVDFDESTSPPDADVILDAVDTQTRYYPVRPTVARLILLITHKDVTKQLDIDDVRTGLKSLDPDHLFAISSYPEMKASGKSILTKPETGSPSASYPNGLHARWVFESDGALMNSRSLEEDRKSLPKFVDVMVDRAKSMVGKCRTCRCDEPIEYTPFLSCSDVSEC